MLGVVHVNVHEHDEDQHDDPAAVNAQDLRQRGRPIELGDDLRAGTAFPRTALQPADDADDDVVHHESEERFVGVPLGLEEGGDQRPDAAGDSARQTHDEEQDSGRDPADPVEGEVARGDGARGDLALGADVPEAHLEAGGDGQRAAEQRHGELDGLTDGGLFAERAGDDGGVAVDRRGAVGQGDHHDEAAEQEREDDGGEANAPDLPRLHHVPLGETDQGNLILVMHGPLPPFRRRRGSSSGRSLPWWRCGHRRCR